MTPKTPITWDNYKWAFGECSRWLATVWEQWDWVTGFHETCRSLRAQVPVTTLPFGPDSPP